MISDSIREIARKTVRNEVRAAILFGTLVSKSPLSVRVEDRLTLSAESLIVPSCLEKRTLLIGSGEFEIVPELILGDRLILINIGGRYLIAGKAGDIENEHIIT